MSQHVVSKKIYFGVFATLIVLTVVTIEVAMIDLGKINTVAALTIAVCKATLVILYFMHVRYSSRLTWIVVACGFFWLIIMIALTMSDYLSRTWIQTSIH
ncbi:MAG TPA: cytochrome C oxidase subunit IV family protein [Terriglobia bacterium]|nr:cytochrome C oxidase subunit IV family protein [Terriglobia bacterium]